MIIATTNYVPGMEVVEYKGFATGEVVAGINFIFTIIYFILLQLLFL